MPNFNFLEDDEEDELIDELTNTLRKNKLPANGSSNFQRSRFNGGINNRRQNILGDKNIRKDIKQVPVTNNEVDIWEKYLFPAVSVITSLIRSVLFISGIIAINLADVAMGTISLSILFNSGIVSSYGYSNSLLGTLISVSATAIQIWMWKLIREQGISITSLSNIKNIKHLPVNTLVYFLVTVFVWMIDNLIDISPVSLIVSGSAYNSVPFLYKLLVVSVYVLVGIICGFGEYLTSDMKSLLSDKKRK